MDDTRQWESLYKLLRPLAKKWVYSARISLWRGQEEEVVDDIVQETITRVYDRLQRAERGEADAVNSIEALSRRIARNYFIDLIRKDRRLLRLAEVDPSMQELSAGQNWADVTGQVDEALFHEFLFTQVAQEIVQFPKKQRLALLIDLSSRMSLDDRPSPVQQAFLKVGVQLKDYRGQCPRNAIELSRHRTLLNIAYKRVSRVTILKKEGS
jgi:DNA-directed RNA polymerase specialized sigma24 family protein